MLYLLEFYKRTKEMKNFLTIFVVILSVSACVQQNESVSDESNFISDESNAYPYNETTNDFMQPDNQYANIDSYKERDEAEKETNENKWNTTSVETRWQDYKGAMVKVQILLGDSDMREMRLRLMQNADGADVDADNRTILSKVADYEMKRVCGRNVKSIVMIYDKPAFDSMRATPYFDYRIEAEGSTMREYGFRCVY